MIVISSEKLREKNLLKKSKNCNEAFVARLQAWTLEEIEARNGV
jgi:hypothetical protein